MNRRKLLALLLAVCMTAAAAFLECGAHSPDTTLILYSQEDCIHPDVLEAFTHETGVTVEYILLDQERGAEQAADAVEQAACDVLLADVELLSQLDSQQCLARLDGQGLSDQAGIDEAFLSLPFIRNRQTALPYLWTTMGLVYDPSRTDTRVTSWANLFQDAFSGRVVMPKSSREAYAIALTALGFSVNTNQPEEISSATDYLQQQMPLVLDYCSLSQLEAQLSANPQLIAPCYGADAIRLMASSANISFVVPSEGSWRKLLAFSLPQGSEDQTMAFELIEFLCQPQAMAKNAAYSGYSTVSTDAYELLDHSWQVNPLAYPTGKDWTVAPLLDSQESQLRTERQVCWHQLRDSWGEYHWEH